MVLRVISPVIVHGDAAFPDKRPSVRIPQSFRRYDLFRTDEIAVPGSRMPLCQRTEPFSAHLQTIVNDHARLQAADHADQFFRLPGFPPHIRIGKIKPENVKLPIIAAQLPDLPVQIVKIAAEVTLFVGISGILPHRVVHVPVMRIIFMVPVQKRIIQADLQTLRPGGVQKLPDQIAPAGRIG